MALWSAELWARERGSCTYRVDGSTLLEESLFSASLTDETLNGDSAVVITSSFFAFAEFNIRSVLPCVSKHQTRQSYTILLNTVPGSHKRHKQSSSRVHGGIEGPLGRMVEDLKH